ncbi:hypothetical protein [Clostridium saccharobutylicum]|uniref:Uncharacterized protein n=1 Tax=Clostridium saccharobutylicum TaxID=169679 RepID=A0A1S8NDN4_CLOSA|nr:hypothetical protein [Clostridium saccharobutylicum]OOM14508.1 hypothetical protein CLOSAC_13880 [Clostridium saccharobutylicum]
MKNKEYEMGYKYGIKIGRYEASYDISVNFFKMTFKKEHYYKINRIKWLSNYEMDVLCDEMLNYISHDKDKSGERNEEKLKKYKENILKLLR